MLLVYCHTISPRLKYILDFFGSYLFDEPIQITTDLSHFTGYNGPKLNYSDNELSEEEFFIYPHTLLFEKGITEQDIECFELNFHKAFFQTRGDLPFDMFAASFYLLSRYEEYLPHQKDYYGRYAHSNSLAFRESFLQYPLVNIWIDQFKQALQRKFPSLLFRHHNFTCIISYDIDMAYSYLNKGWLRNLKGLALSVLKGDFDKASDRWQVLSGAKKDPFDCYEWLDAVHLYCRIKPYFFFLVARRLGIYDKNISIGNTQFQELIRYYASSSKVGLHASWQSKGNRRLMSEELKWLEAVCNKKVTMSRQHYISFTLPQSYRDLLAIGIDKEFSMGYGSVNGFRASVSSPFSWYDLEREEQTSLMVYPFCFMDANSFFEQKQTPQKSYKELMYYYDQVKKVNGTFITIWHNFLLGADEATQGWREVFELFMKETVYWEAYYDEA